MGIKVLQIIDGSYFRYNPNKVLNKKCGYQDILVTMFDYCLRDAAGYFEIVSKWNNKFPLVIKDAITRDSLYYLVNDGKRAAEEPPAAHPLENFIEKFGAWEDECTTEEIIKDIYESRSVSSSESTL